MKAHFVTFNSPGTFFDEQTEKPISAWDTDKAQKMAKDITEWYGAKPYGFFFTTRERGENDLDSKEVKRSNLYFLGGRVMTVEDVKREIPKCEILVANMECNGWPEVVFNDNSWPSIRPLRKGDVIL